MSGETEVRQCGHGKPVPAAWARLCLLFWSLCSVLVDAVLDSFSDNIIEDFKTGRCFP